MIMNFSLLCYDIFCLFKDSVDAAYKIHEYKDQTLIELNIVWNGPGRI